MKARLVFLAVIVAACCPVPGGAQGFVDFAGSALPYIQVEPTFFTGYLFQNKGVSMTIGGKPGGSAGAPSFRQDYDLKGLWLEAMVPVKSTGIMGLAFGGAYYVPFEASSNADYGVDSEGALIQRKWKAQTQWFNWQVAATFSVTPAITAIAGFRHDSFMTNFKDPEDSVNAIGSPYDIGDLTFAAYIPYFGILLHRADTLGQGFTFDAGVVGLPILWGSLQYRERVGGTGLPINGVTTFGIPAYNEFRKGHFLEAFANLGARVGCAYLGAFARFSSVFGGTNVNLGERTSLTPDTDLAFEFQRRSWVIGGKVSMDF